MDKTKALEIVRDSIPIEQKTPYDEILAKAAALVEVKTRGFTYPAGISEVKDDISEYLNEFGIEKEDWLNAKKELLRSETDSLTKWLAPELVRLGHYKKQTTSQKTTKKAKSKKLKLLKLKAKAAKAKLEILKLKN